MASEFLTVAEILFGRHQRPMSARELVDLALEETLMSDRRGGKTPHQTMKAKLSVEIRRNGSRSRFVRTAPGTFYLRRLAYPDQIYEAAPLEPPVSSERVLVFPSRRLDEIGRFQGIVPDGRQVLKRVLAEELTYMDRLQAEFDDDHKQVLTYIMVTRGDEILCYQRGTYNRVADFLRGLGCVGFGGHVVLEDHTLMSFDDAGVRGSACRELAEELRLPPLDRARLDAGEGLSIVGLLNDDSSAVGRRHFAVLFRYEVSDSSAWRTPKRGEKSIAQLRWLTPEPDNPRIEQFEYWSQLCLRAFFPQLVKGKTSYVVRRREPFQSPHVLCMLGQIGSGKTEITSILRSDFDYFEINSGRVVAELIGKSPITPEGESERPSFQERAVEFIRSQEGPKRLARAIWREVEESGHDRIVIDGVRQQATLEALAREAGDWRIARLFIHTPPDIAFEFYRSRRGPRTTIEEFTEVREAPVEEEVSDLISVADAVIYNWVGKRTLRARVRALMKEVGVTRR